MIMFFIPSYCVQYLPIVLQYMYVCILEILKVLEASGHVVGLHPYRRWRET